MRDMIKDKIKENIDLRPMSSFKIGGTAEFFADIETKADLLEAVEWSRSNNKKLLVLGGGSNVLVNDQGVKGLVVRIKNDSIEPQGDCFFCGSGLLLAKAMIYANKAGLSGLEWAIGIPGTIGGALRGNAGAFGHSIGESVKTVEVYNNIRGNFDLLQKNDCDFSYRNSIFKADNNTIIWGASLKLDKSDPEDIRTLLENYLTKRASSQPKLPSAGSIFMNLPIEMLEKSNSSLAKMAAELGIIKDGYVGAGWIVDLLGLKGKTIGGAKVSLEHANFIVNTGRAKSEEVIMLISLIKQQARDKFGVQLHEEIQYFGM